MSWNQHIENACQLLNQTNGMIAKLRHYVTQNTCKQIYFALFYSKILHGSLSWQYTSKTNINKVFKLQKKCLRMMTFSDFDAPSDPLFKKLELLKLQDIFNLRVIEYIYDYFNTCLPPTLNKMFTLASDIHSHQTRSVDKLFIPQVRSHHYGTNSLTYSAPALWNSFLNITDLLNNVPSKCILKKRLKTHFLKAYENI